MSTDDVSGLPSSIRLRSQSNARTRQFWDDDSGFWEDPATFLAIDELTLADIKGEPSPANPARDGLPPANLPTGFHIISHSPRIQEDLDRLGIPWGAQYELARGESRGRWKWDDITRVELECLVGRNAEAAPKVVNLILRTQRSEPVDDIVWCVRFTYSSLSVGNT